MPTNYKCGLTVPLASLSTCVVAMTPYLAAQVFIVLHAFETAAGGVALSGWQKMHQLRVRQAHH